MTSVTTLFSGFNIDVNEFNPKLWAKATEEMGIVEMEYDVTEVLAMLEGLGIDTTTIDTTTMYELLLEVNWEEVFLDATLIHEFLSSLGVDYTTIDPTLMSELYASLGIVEMPFDVNGVLSLLESVGVNTSRVKQDDLYAILLGVDWDTYVITKYSIASLMTDIGVVFGKNDPVEQYVEDILALIEVEWYPIDVNILGIMLVDLGAVSDISELNLVGMHSEISVVDYANTDLNKMWMDAFLSMFNIDSSTFVAEEYYTQLFNYFGIEAMPFTGEQLLEWLEVAGVNTRGAKPDTINQYLYTVDWDNTVLTIDDVDALLLEYGFDVRFLGQLEYHILLANMGVEIPTMDSAFVLDVMSQLNIQDDTITSDVIDNELAGIDFTTTVIDADGIIEFFMAIGADISTIDVQAVI